VKLLFITQVYDPQDAVLGFVAGWIRELAARCDTVQVICLEAGDLSQRPANVQVRVLGRHGYVRRWWRWRRYMIEAFAAGCTHVLAHMVPRYATWAVRPARKARAKVCLWYTHAGVDQRLVEACAKVDLVFTASHESLRVATPNKVVTGHGIDTQHFRATHAPAQAPRRILSVGRLTRSKDPLVIVDALALLVQAGVPVHLDLVGAGLVEADAAYRELVLQRIAHHQLEEHVTLHGSIPWLQVPAYFERASVVINASHTGSIDKVVLEAMAMQRPVVSCNEAVPPLLHALGARAASLAFAPGDAASLAQQIQVLLRMPEAEYASLGWDLRTIVERDHEVGALMQRLVQRMESLS